MQDLEKKIIIFGDFVTIRPGAQPIGPNTYDSPFKEEFKGEVLSITNHHVIVDTGDGKSRWYKKEDISYIQERAPEKTKGL